jgi:SAM-dependent methyltransferase
MGSMVEWMATSLAPSGHITAIEKRANLAAEVAARRLPSVEVKTLDIEAVRMPSDAYDLIYSRYVFEHLPHRRRVLIELHDSLAPGGWIVIEDVILSSRSSVRPRVFGEALMEFASAKPESDYRWAASLPKAMRAAGLADIRAARLCDEFAAGSELALFWASVLLQEVNAKDKERFTACARAAAMLEVGPGWFRGPVVVQAAGRKTTSWKTDLRESRQEDAQ